MCNSEDSCALVGQEISEGRKVSERLFSPSKVKKKKKEYNYVKNDMTGNSSLVLV